eukprot:3589281-Karenia_brevis.AAC.1
MERVDWGNAQQIPASDPQTRGQPGRILVPLQIFILKKPSSSAVGFHGTSMDCIFAISSVGVRDACD